MDSGPHPEKNRLTFNVITWLNEYMSKTKTTYTGPNVRTTVELPETLWMATKTFAASQRSDLRATIIAALEQYLKAHGKGKKP